MGGGVVAPLARRVGGGARRDVLGADVVVADGVCRRLAGGADLVGGAIACSGAGVGAVEAVRRRVPAEQPRAGRQRSVVALLSDGRVELAKPVVGVGACLAGAADCVVKRARAVDAARVRPVEAVARRVVAQLTPAVRQRPNGRVLGAEVPGGRGPGLPRGADGVVGRALGLAGARVGAVEAVLLREVAVGAGRVGDAAAGVWGGGEGHGLVEDAVGVLGRRPRDARGARGVVGDASGRAGAVVRAVQAVAGRAVARLPAAVWQAVGGRVEGAEVVVGRGPSDASGARCHVQHARGIVAARVGPIHAVGIRVVAELPAAVGERTRRVRSLAGVCSRWKGASLTSGAIFKI